MILDITNLKKSFNNLIRIVKDSLQNKANINTPNTFTEDIKMNKKLYVKNSEDQYVDILDTISGISTKSHTHKNFDVVNRISDIIQDDGGRNLTYDNVEYQKKFPFEMDSEILSKFNVDGNTLYFDQLKVIDPESIPQQNYSETKKSDQSEEVEISFRSIVTENSIVAITRSELTISNKSTDTEVDIIVRNDDIDGMYTLTIPPSTTHKYEMGISKTTIISYSGIVDYVLNINYF